MLGDQHGVRRQPLGRVWFVLRLLMGFCQAGLFTVVEGWLSAAAPAQSRGGVLSFYLVSTKVAIVGGQLVHRPGRHDVADLVHVVASAVFTLALIPVALTHTPQPPSPRLELLGPREPLPAGAGGGRRLPCFGPAQQRRARADPDLRHAAGAAGAFMVWLLSAVQLGSFVCQWPLGRLSDRVDRRWVIAGCVLAVAAAVGRGRPGRGQAGTGCCRCTSFYGASTLTFYAVAVAHAADFAEPDQMVGVSGGRCWPGRRAPPSGPTVAAPFIDLLGPAGLFLYSVPDRARPRRVRAVADDPAGAAAAGAARRASSTCRPPRRGWRDIDPRMPERPAA